LVAMRTKNPWVRFLLVLLNVVNVFFILYSPNPMFISEALNHSHDNLSSNMKACNSEAW